VRFETASELLAYANQYLDDLENRPPESEEEARERMMEVRSLISEMRRFNFHAPKFGIKQAFKSLAYIDKEELLEAIPFLQEFIYSLNIRQWTYERAKVAYLSNRLSWFILKERWLTEFFPYLPYGGDYLSFTSVGGGASYLVFRDLEKILRGEGGLRAIFRGERLESIVREKGHGPFSRTTSIILASLSVKKAVQEHMEEIIKGERKKIPEYDVVVAYERLVARYDIQKLGENPELFSKLLQELEEAGFLDRDGSGH